MLILDRKWPLVGNVLLCLACHQLINNHQTHALQSASTSKPAPTAKESNGVDEILRDTFQLLDSLDQRLDAVTNKTKNNERQDNFRMLKGVGETGAKLVTNNRNIEEERRLTSLAEGFSSERRPTRNHDEPDPLNVASSNPQQQRSSNKKPRQLSSPNDSPPPTQSAGLGRFTDNDFTEKHIRFSLDLMRAVFSSQSYTSKSNAIDSFLISPVSIQMVLMMMHLGARGQTKLELSNCLHMMTPAKQAPPAGNTTNLSANGSLVESQQNKNAKLSRRHQQQQAATQASNHKQPHHQRQQTQQAQSNNVHEQFGSAMRQLLKDQLVVKALSSANQIFVQKDLPLMPQYEWAVKNYYGTELKLVDYQNQNFDQQQNKSTANATSNNIQLMVNDWIERQTKGKIVNFLSSPVPSSTLLMALNVLFFKGDWQYKFDPADTDPDAWFTLTDGRTVKVPMMVNKLPLAHAHDASMKASLIELPYKAQRLGLFILLPDEVNGIFETMQLLNSSSFANLISMMRKPTSAGSTGDAGINVRIPKFTIESSPRMSHILSQQLGLKTLFTPDLADLSGMFSPAKARIKQANQSSAGPEDSQPAPMQVGLDELHHKAMLQVHEQGSVAAAASATIVERVGLFNGQYFEADHPFLLFLMDKQTGLVLFSGVFAGPPEGSKDGLSASQSHQSPANATQDNHLAGRSLKPPAQSS